MAPCSDENENYVVHLKEQSIVKKNAENKQTNKQKKETPSKSGNKRQSNACSNYAPLECPVLLDQLEETGDTEVADHLIESLDAARCRRWEETTEQMNFTKSSRKSWSLIRRLGAAQNPPRTSHPPVKADAVASHLLQVSRAPVNKKHKRI